MGKIRLPNARVFKRQRKNIVSSIPLRIFLPFDDPLRSRKQRDDFTIFSGHSTPSLSNFLGHLLECSFLKPQYICSNTSSDLHLNILRLAFVSRCRITHLGLQAHLEHPYYHVQAARMKKYHLRMTKPDYAIDATSKRILSAPVLSVGIRLLPSKTTKRWSLARHWQFQPRRQGAMAQHVLELHWISHYV